MSINNEILAMLKEAKVYNNHGLLDESRSKYNQALEIIQANQQLSNRKALIQLIESKIAAIPQDPFYNQGSEIEQPIFETDTFESMDIIFIAIALDAEPGQRQILGLDAGQILKFDVDFQSGNILTIIIPKKKKHLIDQLKEEVFLNKALYYSSIAFFRGAGEVTSCAEIKSGPKKGNYCLKIKVVD